MGYLFEKDDATIWSPSRDAGEFFLAQIRHLEAHLETQSGLDEYMSDTVEVDFQQLEFFLLRIGRMSVGTSESLQLLVRGVVIFLLAILLWDRELSSQIAETLPGEWIDEAKAVSRRHMQRET